VSAQITVPARADLDALTALDTGPLLPSFDVHAVNAVLRASFTRAATYHYDTIREGRTFRLEVGLGTVAVRSHDPARRERRADNPELRHHVPRAGGYHEHAEHHADTIMQAVRGSAQWAGMVDPGSYLLRPARPPGRRVSEWSRKSRARMLRAYAELDYSVVNRQPGVAAMVTLTYPGDWITVAADAASVKRHLRLLRMRWWREFGYIPAGLWKLEFQARGAPHLHLFVSVPAITRDGRTFERWLSENWADIVGHPDACLYARLGYWTDERGVQTVCDRRGRDGLPCHRHRHLRSGTGVDFSKAERCTDGRRLAVYFLKHGTKTKDGKEYQNQPPREWDVFANPATGEVVDDGGTGRFWGYWGMKRRVGSVDLPLRDFYALRRILRRWRASQGQAVRGGLGVGGGNSGGWCLVNDGPAFAALLSRSLAANG
jgi:hypothetical protein